jgi:hypothetical protein
MAVSSSQYSVGTAASLVAQAPGGVPGGGPVASYNFANGTGATVYLGAAGVTSTSGFALGTSAALSGALHPGGAVYAVTASRTSTSSVLIT